MARTNRSYRPAACAAVIMAASLVAACGLDKQSPPALTGPSEFGLAVTLTATPDQLPRDGSSQSVVTLTARDSSNRALAGLRLSLALVNGSPSGARLSQNEVTTNSQGSATFTVSAPNQGSTGNQIVVMATPIGTNGDNAVSHRIAITVNPSNGTAPTASFTVNPTTPDIGQVVTFNGSATDEGVPCGSCSFLWDFGGEGTATGAVVTHTFGSAGTFVVSLTATDSAGTTGATVRQNVTVSAASIPTGLSVASTPNPPVAKQTATFTASATPATNHRIVTYQFVWGDGDTNTSNSPIIQHTYSQAGDFLLTLTVRDDLGQSSTRNFVITVSSGLTVDFSNNPASPTNGQTVTFTATATSTAASTITNYSWDFDGDGTFETDNGASAIVQKSFSTGTYQISLKVTDSRGVTQTKTKTLTVQ